VAREQAVPVMVGVSECERAFVGVRQATAAVKAIREELGIPVFLNADHTRSLEKAEEAARSGFDEIIFDRSELPIDQNARETRQAVEAIKSIDPSVLVEGEIGYIGTSSEILDKVPEGMGALTTPEEGRQFISATGVDVLAPAVGNMHGLLSTMVQGQARKRPAAPEPMMTTSAGRSTRGSTSFTSIRSCGSRGVGGSRPPWPPIWTRSHRTGSCAGPSRG